jgi:hypothetical protein
VNTSTHDVPRRVTVVFEPESALSSMWFGQGREFDYGAQGSTLTDVQANFIRGMKATIELRCERGLPPNVGPCKGDWWDSLTANPEVEFFTLDTATWTWEPNRDREGK